MAITATNGTSAVADGSSSNAILRVTFTASEATTDFKEADITVSGGTISNICLKHGLILRPVGDSMCFCPPLIITESEINALFDAYEVALNEGLDHLTKEGKAVA